MNIFRWIIFLPAAFFIYYLILSTSETYYQSYQFFAHTSKNELSLGAAVYRCIVAFLSSLVATTVSCLIAPRAKERIAIIFTVTNTFFVCGMFLNLKFSDPRIWSLACSLLFAVVGNLASVIIIKSHLKRPILRFSNTASFFLIYSLTNLMVFTLSLFLISKDNSVSAAIGIVIGFLSIVLYSAIIAVKKAALRKSNQSL